MDSSLNPSCPFSVPTNLSYKVTFKEAPPQAFFTKLFFFLMEYLSRISFKSFQNAWRIGSTNDLSKTFMQAWKPNSFVSTCRTPAGSVYVTADTTIMRAIFQNPRAHNEGLFLDHENKKIFVKGILNDLYPEEIKALGIDNVAKMIVFTAPFPEVKSLRSPMMNILGSACIKDFTPDLNNIANEIIDSLSESEKAACNAEALAFEFAITVLCKLMTGYCTTRENYQSLAIAINAFGKRLGRLISHRPTSAQEESEFQTGLITIRETIDNNIHSTETTPFISSLKELGWDEFKIKITLLFIYFAATETTSSSMNYLLWQLGKKENKHFTEELNHPENGELFLSKLIMETLRLHPPAFIVGRQFRQDTLLEIQNSNNKIVKRIRLRKGHSILCLPQAAALDPLHYSEPHRFNPYRFETIRPQLPWYPFASGNHVCPGQYLAHAELKVFISQLTKRFDIQNIYPEECIHQAGFFTLRATPAVIKLMDRKGG